MKTKQKNRWIFAAVKLQTKRYSLLTIIVLAALIVFTMTACSESDNVNTPTDQRPQTPEAMSNKTALQYFTDEGIMLGINVGNSLDAVDTWTNPDKPISIETAWGNLVVNQAYINGLKTLGYKIVRIPVTWTGHIGPAPDYKIEDAWIKRVAEVVGYAKTAGLKAFINIHHDGHHDNGAWLDISKAMANTTDRAQIAAKYEAVWKQIAEYFKNYGDWLMFEGFNEIHDGSWDEGNGTDTVAKYAIINDWNQCFTNTVRGTGGNNERRYLIYHGYNTSYTIADTGTQFKLPTDTATGRQIVAFHFYFPWSFAGDANDPNWSTETSDKSQINTVFSNMKTKFINNNIPVIIGENGPARYTKHQNNSGYSSTNVATAQQKRLEYIDYFYGKAREKGLIPCYWENGTYPGETAEEGDFVLINRSNGQPNSTESRTVIERMITAINNTTPISPSEPVLTITLEDNAPYGYQKTYYPASLFNGAKITTGDVYTLTFAFKSSVAIDKLQVNLVDNCEATSWAWNIISGYIEIKSGITANTEYSGSITITATGTATDNTPEANRLVFQAGTGTSSAPTLTFTAFSLVKN